ncbi:MAG: cell division ATP-binding protein FtsE [Peptococcaceae bacterium]|nr:cell division ATP-binding protein FtsE [Peptococcaceae bacterium]
MIQLRNVSKVYPNGSKALTRINLEVPKNDFVFLVGSSGAGKSTLIKLLFREELATRGKVLINGVDVVRLKNRQVPYMRRKMGVIFQDFKLLPNQTVFENVAFAQRVLGQPTKKIRTRTMQMLDLVGLASKHKAFPDELSGGEQQRVCVARAMINSPELLLADEPTGNLDVDTAWGIADLLCKFNELGTTIVMSTHAMHIVENLNKRVVRVEGGEIVEDTGRHTLLAKWGI